MAKRELQFDDGKSQKFWTISLEGTSHTVTFGRIGTTGQTRTKNFETNAEAKKSYDKLVGQKLAKGYAEAVTREVKTKAVAVRKSGKIRCITQSNKYGTIAEKQLAQFENEFCKLPTEYRDFLLEHNGGKPSPNGFVFGEDEFPDRVECFFPLYSEVDHSDLASREQLQAYTVRQALAELQEHFAWQEPEPELGMLPIGTDGCGNLICVVVDGDIGKIVFFEHEESRIYPLADSLTDFLAGLAECEPNAN